jgi:prepilin-type N-terminal cleavage/methylation domain-containing protein
MFSKQKSRLRRAQSGFTLVQLLITIAIASILSTFAFLGITSARSAIRLSNSTRQFGSYVERARADAIRRHGVATVQLLTDSSYSVTMDFGGDGSVTTQTFQLQNGVSFITTLETITFDWRGRLPSEISVGFGNESGTANVNITGSGDITIDSEIFHDDSVPDATLSANVSPDVIPEPTLAPGHSPTPPPDSSPTPEDPSATPTPTPATDPTPKHTPPGQSPTPTPEPTPSATPTATATPTPTPQATPCTLLATPPSLTVVQNGSGNISVIVAGLSGTTTISATSNNSAQIQVSPESRTVTNLGAAVFTITVKRQSGSVSFSTGCGSKTVSVTVN